MTILATLVATETDQTFGTQMNRSHMVFGTTKTFTAYFVRHPVIVLVGAKLRNTVKPIRKENV